MTIHLVALVCSFAVARWHDSFCLRSVRTVSKDLLDTISISTHFSMLVIANRCRISSVTFCLGENGHVVCDRACDPCSTRRHHDGAWNLQSSEPGSRVAKIRYGDVQAV